MGIFDELFASSSMIYEQLTREISNCIPEDGIFLTILDREGYFWSSSPEKFDEVFTEKPSLAMVCGYVDDGADPFIKQFGTTVAIVSQINTVNGASAYAVMCIENSDVEKAIEVLPALEFGLNMLSMCGRLLDKNNEIHHDNLKQYIEQ